MPAPVLCLIGTRPEAIKMAPVIRALGSDCRVVLTGQHDELVDDALRVFDIRPDYNLAIMRPGQGLHSVAADCLRGIKTVIEECRPRMLLVQGDTASVAFGALAGFMSDVQVGHVEAGLRSGSKQHPFPEEGFRKVTSAIADFHFAPTWRAADNLVAEGISDNIFITGNTVVDALEYASSLPHEVEDEGLYEALASGRRLILLTMHRRESFGQPMREVFEKVRMLADERPDVTILYPVHPNPEVQKAAQTLANHPRIILTRPLGYLDMITAMKQASVILTDSGGLQEEAPAFRVPCVVLRQVTERQEAVEAGFARLGNLLINACDALDGRWKIADAVNPFGDGQAGSRIARIVLASLQG